MAVLHDHGYIKAAVFRMFHLDACASDMAGRLRGLEVVPLGVTKGYRLKHGVGAHPRHTWTLTNSTSNVRACTRPSANDLGKAWESGRRAMSGTRDLTMWVAWLRQSRMLAT
ncbi:hypothetical protein CK203_095829 [Vitis vinifera]|uniref:Uncharacterized protein n=1 Tax=Vitis vinifera TaxID=29760 RepID=A0A438CK57_VITVI|nr:hypothetical protein CK203_095829 [Vitis vinifera]